MIPRRVLLAAVLTLFCFCAQPLLAADYSWLDGLSMITLEETGPQAIHDARIRIQELGGTVGVMSTGGVLLAWLDGIPSEELTGHAGISSVHDSPVSYAELGFAVQKRPSDLPYFVEFFNSAVSGRFALAQNAKAPVPALRAPGGDALAPEPLDWEAYVRNLESKGYSREQLNELGLLDASKSPDNDSMSGTILASVFIVESDGSGSDPNNHDWSQTEVQDIVNARIAGCLFWSSSAKLFANCWAAFLIEVYLPSDPRLQSPLEPVHSEEVSTVMAQVMANFGYGGGAYSANSSFNTARRLATGSHRAYSMITTWGSGRAWAYRFGPYTWLPFPTAAPEVTAHETGHIFGACDEYEEACGNCPSPGCSANGVGNPNCETCPGAQPCVMIANNYVLCNYTDDHVGWSLSPCAPPTLPAPTLIGISPSSGFAGETVTVTITGTNILQAAQLTLGVGVTVFETEYIGGNTIIAEATINTITAPGMRDLQLTNPDLKKVTLTEAFEVLATPSHYFSPTGGNVFPYVTPGNAATTLQEAINAAGPGDTIYMEATTLNGLNILLTRDVTFSGGWDSGFSSQDLLLKTVIDPTPNLRATANLGFENVRFINGEGRTEVLPVEGAYGGAVAVFGAGLTLDNCEFEGNTALDPADVGLGGAAYVEGGPVTISNTQFVNNSAYLGGALYLENCDVNISNSSFTGNDIQLGGSVGGDAAGIYALNCSSFVFENSSMDSNVGADRGGAIFMQSCSGIQVLGGSISNHSATQQGGALWIDAGSGLIQGMDFANNAASSAGGAIYAASGTSLSLFDNSFSGNSALLGAGFQISGGEAFVDHNLFTGNQATATGHAIYISTVTDGSVIGNVAADNLGTVTSSDILVIGSSIEVKNNVLLSSPGVGITCSGSPDVDFNLIHASGGTPYSGCSLGANTLSGDPLFVGGGDYHLGLHSPGIDSGEPTRPDPDGSPGDLGIYGAHALLMEQPAAPTNLGSQLQGSDVVLSWDPNGEGDLASYAVYMDPVSGFQPSLSNFVGLVPAGTTTLNLGQLAGTRYLRVNAIDNDGYAGGYSAELLVDPATSVDPPQRHQWALMRATPNPFNPRTRIEYELASTASVELIVFDVTGRVVRTLVRASQPAGLHAVEWDSRNDSGHAVASGIYYYELRAGSFRATEKMVLLK